MKPQNHSLTTRPNALALALAMAFTSTALMLPVQGQAQSAATLATAAYAIEAGPLDKALEAIGKQSGRTIKLDPASVQNMSAPAIRGNFTAEQALRLALQGSGLEISVASGGVISIVAVVPVATNKALETNLPAITVVAKRDQAETSFKVDRSSTSTRSDTDLLDQPISVSVVSAKVLESKQAATLEDAISNVSGVIYTKSPQGAGSFTVRGLEAPVLSDGLGSATDNLSGSLASSASTNGGVFGVERIEVLKGPQAILSGANTLGGAVNIVTKKPQAEPIRELLIQYASGDEKTVAGDLSGALIESNKLTYRLVASGLRQSHTRDDYKGNRSTAIMPELRWKDDSTDVIVGLSSNRRRIAAQAYTFALDGQPPQQEPSQLLGTEEDGIDIRARNYFYTLNQKLGQNVGFTSKMQFSRANQNLHIWSPLGLISATNVFYAPAYTRSTLDSSSGDHYFDFKFNTGPLKHKLIAGANHGYVKYKMDGFDASGSGVYEVYGDSLTFPAIDGPLSASTRMRSRQLGYYATEQLTWDRFHLVGGIRRTKFSSVGQTAYVSQPTQDIIVVSPERKSWRNTPMAGLVYNITPEISAYTSYTEGFSQMIVDNLCSRGISEPRRTKNREAGMKFDLFDSQLSLTTSVFKLDLLNTSRYNGSLQCNEQIASQMSKGFEVDVAGQVFKGMNVLVNAIYSRTSDASRQVSEYAARPKLRGSFWANYDFQSPALSGWGTGLGATATGASLLNDQTSYSTNPSKLAGSVRWDGSVYYRQKNWSLMLGIKNLGDRKLYDLSSSAAYVPLQDRRKVTLTYRVNL